MLMFRPTESRGLSARSVRRFCKERNISVTLRWISDEHLEEMVTNNILQVKLNFVNCGINKTSEQIKIKLITNQLLIPSM